MSKHFEVTTPRPLGHRQTVNSRDEDEMNQAVELLAEKLAPMVAKLLEGKAPATNGSNGRKLNPSDITSRHFQGLPDGDEWDTLPDGDDAPSPTGDHFDNLPTD